MLTFPQLSTGCIAQFPIRRMATMRSLVNEALDGREIRMPDVDAGTVVWDLRFAGLSDQEKGAIEDLFVAAQGRLRSFAFVDPMANLVAHSDELSAAEWVRSPLVTVTPGVAGPSGGSAAWTLQTPDAASGGVSQSVGCPGGMRY